MINDNKVHTIISDEEIIIRKNKGSEIVLGYNSTFEDSLKYYNEDEDTELFYIQILEKNNTETEIELGIPLSKNQLQNFINTARKLIRKIETQPAT